MQETACPLTSCRFPYSLDNPFDFTIIAGNDDYVWTSLHSKVVSKHSKVLARIVEESREVLNFHRQTMTLLTTSV